MTHKMTKIINDNLKSPACFC